MHAFYANHVFSITITSVCLGNNVLIVYYLAKQSLGNIIFAAVNLSCLFNFPSMVCVLTVLLLTGRVIVLLAIL